MWWIATFAGQVLGQGRIYLTYWGNILVLTSLTASMTVNALVTGLIVFKIFRVFRQVKYTTSSDMKSLGVTGGRKLCSIIFVIIESGMALFVIQLARLAITATWILTDAESDAFTLITVGIHEMLNVIISSVICYFVLY
jgi:hypothetical protein